MTTMAMGSAIASPSQEVVLRGGGEGLADQHVAADEHLGRVELVGEVLDLVGDRELGVLVEVAGEGDHDERGASVGGPQGVGPGRPGVGDVEHAVERGDRRQAGGDPGLDLRVVDVDVVGDDGDLATGLGQVVELLGDSARLGGGAGAEVGRQDREGRAADGGGDEEQRDPGEDDGAPAAHHETPEPAHHDDRLDRSGRRRARRRAGLRRSRVAYRTPARALTAKAPEEPNMACWRSASTITCEVISQPPAQSSGCGDDPQDPVDAAASGPTWPGPVRRRRR